MLDRAQAVGRHAQLHALPERIGDQGHVLQIGQERALGLINGVTAKGGRAPSFEVETGSVKVGTGEANVTVPNVTLGKENKTVQVPKIEVRPAADQGNKSAH